MGIYMGSPWGQIRGKLFDTVGGVWKGINWCRNRVLPTQRGTLLKYRQLKDGILDPWEFSYPQMNIRRVSLQVLGYIARLNEVNLIIPVWEALVKKRAWVMTGLNAFVKRSAANFYHSLTDTSLEYDPTDNPADNCQILMSDGDLEPVASITSCTYDDTTGDLVIVWDPAIFTNGDPDDKAFILALKDHAVGGLMESIGRDGTWYPGTYLYGTALPLPPPGVDIARAAGTMTIPLPTGLDPTLLTAYLFFRDEQGIIGYSKSKCCEVTAPV